MSKYVDIPAIIQVIGNIYNNPSLLDEKDKYSFYEEDFTEEFHKILFGSIYNLYMLGAKKITTNTIEDYLSQKPKSLAVYKLNKGAEYLNKISENIQFSAFDYYYNRMRKMTLLRMYHNFGMDLSWLYDPDNILDVKKKERQEEWLDNNSVVKIAEIINNKINDIKIKYADNFESNTVQAGNGIDDLINLYRETPDFGYPMYGAIINTICRGARLKKLYMRSATTGLGKTRSMIADACNFACNELYDNNSQQWVSNGTSEPTIFITTEQELSEIQSMMLAFISNVDESHIVRGYYLNDEYERVLKAAEILKNAPLYIEELPDFSMQDIENCIKRGIKEHEVRYIIFDYIHSSMKILSEISSKSGIKGLREDNILFLIGVRLKDIATQYGVFILTATQLNGNYINAKEYDQNLLRGAKSLGDKIDLGLIMLKVDSDDIEALGEILKNGNFETPDIKISVYKNRGNRYKDILLWCKSDKGVCKINPLFVTDYSYELISIEDIKINVIDKMQDSAF